LTLTDETERLVSIGNIETVYTPYTLESLYYPVASLPQAQSPSFFPTIIDLFSNSRVIVTLSFLILAIIALIIIIPHKVNKVYLCVGSMVIFSMALIAFYLTEVYISPFAFYRISTDVVPSAFGFGFTASIYNRAVSVLTWNLPYLIFFGQLIAPIITVCMMDETILAQKVSSGYVIVRVMKYSLVSFGVLLLLTLIILALMWIIQLAIRSIWGILLVGVGLFVIGGSGAHRNVIYIRGK